MKCTGTYSYQDLIFGTSLKDQLIFKNLLLICRSISYSWKLIRGPQSGIYTKN